MRFGEQVKSGQGRILVLTSNFPRWKDDSVTPFVLHLAEDLAALGWDVDVLAPHAAGAARVESFGAVRVSRFQYWWPARQQQLCYNGGALVNLRTRGFARLQVLPFALAELWAIVRAMATRRYDLIHSHWILPQGFLGSIAGKLFRIPNVISVHGGDIFGLQGKWLGRAKRVALKRATRVTANSSFTEAAIRDLIRGRTDNILRIPMGVGEPGPSQPERLAAIRSGISGSGFLVAFVGRLVPEKGAADAIEAIRILKKRGIPCRAMIIGDGPSRSDLERLASELGLADQMHFLGWLKSEEVAAHLAAADVFVGPSRRSPEGWVEAQGLSFGEAMMAGTPVIATRSGGIPDTVRDEQTGLLVDEHSPIQIAAAIERLRNDPALSKRLAKQGQKFAKEKLTRHASAQQFSHLFTEVVQRGKTRKAERG